MAARGDEDSGGVPFDVFALTLSGRELWAMCKACELTSDALPLAAIDHLFNDGAAIQAETPLDFARWLLGLIRLAIAHRDVALKPAEEKPTAEAGVEEAEAGVGAKADAGAAEAEAAEAGDAEAGETDTGAAETGSRAKADDLDDDTASKGLVGALASLLTDKVLRHGERADADAFRREFWSKAVQKQLHSIWFPLKVRRSRCRVTLQPLRCATHAFGSGRDPARATPPLVARACDYRLSLTSGSGSTGLRARAKPR
jgi:hypothetical protein